MKVLFQDSVVSKLKKIPTFVWFLLLVAAEFAASAYVTLNNADYMANEYAQVLADSGVTFSATVFTVVFCVFTPLIQAALCELLMRVAYAVVRRFAIGADKIDFCFRIRLVVILADLILGLIGILYFFFPVVTDVMTAVFECSVLGLLLAWFYEDFRARFVPRKLHARAFSFVSKIYLGIYLAIGVLNLLYSLVFYLDQLTALDLTAIIVSPSVVLLLGGLAFLNYVRLKKISSEPDDELHIDDNEEKPKDDTIFKDFGF